MKKFKLYIIVILHLLFLTHQTFSQKISPYFFGQCAWMPDSIGSKKYSGKLHSKWKDIKNSNAQIIRFGGIGVDENMPTNHQYIEIIDSIIANGMEPMIQVPFYNGKYTASQAAEIVKYINIIKGKNIKYWIIGNELDHVYGYTSSSQIASYFKTFASAMKAVDPSIKTIGPEMARYNTKIIDDLTTPHGPDDITGKDDAGRYYLDIISFHTYPFNGSQSRSSVISNLTDLGKFQDNLSSLNSRITNSNNAHGRTGSNTLKMAVTEANVNWQNNESDNLYGVGANSFIGGQFWAEMMGIALKEGVEFFNFWSVVEGNNQALNIGYIDRFSGNRQPTFHHFKMMSDNFKGEHCDGITNLADIKSFGSKNTDQIVVMILNQSGNNYNYTLRLNTGTVSGNSVLKININANVDLEYTDVINNQSSILLVFDVDGNIIKKCDYNIEVHASANLPPSCNTYTKKSTPTIATTSAGPPGLKVYPNPAKDDFTVDYTAGHATEEKVAIKMIDQTGKVIISKELDLLEGQIKEKVELRDYSISSGIYVLQLTSGNDVYNSRIILTK